MLRLAIDFILKISRTPGGQEVLLESIMLMLYAQTCGFMNHTTSLCFQCYAACNAMISDCFGRCGHCVRFQINSCINRCSGIADEVKSQNMGANRRRVHYYYY